MGVCSRFALLLWQKKDWWFLMLPFRVRQVMLDVNDIDVSSAYDSATAIPLKNMSYSNVLIATTFLVISRTHKWHKSLPMEPWHGL